MYHTLCFSLSKNFQFIVFDWNKWTRYILNIFNINSIRESWIFLLKGDKTISFFYSESLAASLALSF